MNTSQMLDVLAVIADNIDPRQPVTVVVPAKNSGDEPTTYVLTGARVEGDHLELRAKPQ